MAIAASAVAAQAQVQFFFDEYEWRTAVSEVEGLNTCAANVALAEEVTPPLEPNTHLCGWPPISDCMLTFGAMDTGLSRSFELEPLQEEPSLSAGLTFDDNEGPTSAWDAAISIGDIDNSEDDDFEIRITSG
ncbi:MAG: hypothetical protein GY722_26520, partial [bacterium]|nr:hypothetical protein [bacterium]